jgi:hypothetical protein
MNDWWKDPRLDDEGAYDYLIEELPKDYARWEISKYKWRCDDCGKESHICFASAHHFYCWDGWDSMSWNACWKCRLKDVVASIKHKIKRKVQRRARVIKTAIEFKKCSSAGNFMYWYNFAAKIEK